MNAIVPRWEWRTFGTSFGAADERFAALAVEKVQESDETYLLSPVNDANVKIRDDLMDIKTLVELSSSGLEQWRPVMKATFPLQRDTMGAVCEALGITPPGPATDSTSLDQLVKSLAGQGVRAIAVRKRRARYTIGGCTSEMTDVTADGRPIRSVAIESEDASAVLAAVSAMKLDGVENLSYPRGLKSLVGMPARGR